MAIIKWLHVSDLHLNIDGVENRRLRKKLIEYLQNLSIQCGYIFCTGDLRYAPMGNMLKIRLRYLKTYVTQ